MEIAVPHSAEETKAKPARPEDMAHKLVMDDVEEGRWSSAKTAGIAWRCMVLAGMMLAIFNSGSVLDASRKLPEGPLRIYGEQIAETWHGWMTDLGATGFRETLHNSVQDLRQTPWPRLVWPERAEGDKKGITFPSLLPGSGVNEAKEALKEHRARIIDNHNLVKCLKSKAYRDAVDHHYKVKRQMEKPGFASISRVTLENDPFMAAAAEEICGFRASGLTE